MRIIKHAARITTYFISTLEFAYLTLAFSVAVVRINRLHMRYMHYMFNTVYVQYALCMHFAWLLYKLHVDNCEIEVGPDSRQVPKHAVFWLKPLFLT